MTMKTRFRIDRCLLVSLAALALFASAAADRARAQDGYRTRSESSGAAVFSAAPILPEQKVPALQEEGFELLTPFTYELREYDSALDQPFLKQDHERNQAALDQAFRDYEARARATKASYRRLYPDSGEELAPLDRRIDDQLEAARFELERLKIEDDMAYRQALGTAQARTENESEQAEEARLQEIERRAAEQENLQKRKAALQDAKRKQLQNRFESAGAEFSRTSAVEDLEAFIAESEPTAPGYVLPPEEFYPSRIDSRSLPVGIPSRREQRYGDRFVIDTLVGADTTSAPIPENSK